MDCNKKADCIAREVRGQDGVPAISVSYPDTDILFDSVQERWRPEDVAKQILIKHGEFTARQRAVLNKAARFGQRRAAWKSYSGGMAQDFDTAIPLEDEVRRINMLFTTAAQDVPPDDDAAVESLIRRVSAEVGKEWGRNNFVQDRLNRAERRARGIDLSKRRYNRMWRALADAEERVAAFRYMKRMERFKRGAKSGLAYTITREDMQDPRTAAFIAYFTARANRRSVFTVDRQSRPYDEVADMLLRRCKESPTTTNWAAIARVWPVEDVVQRLTAQEQGALLGAWFDAWHEAGEWLARAWEEEDMAAQREFMVVQRGNNSDAWNAAAGAWNKARTAWLNIVYATGSASIVEHFAPGKVMRLMAGDVAAWHYSAGDDWVDDNVKVWRRLPLPWTVLAGDNACTRADVEAACCEVGIDPYRTGWLSPLAKSIAPTEPTPTLVHGVRVSSPALARVLRKHGCFAGLTHRTARKSVPVEVLPDVAVALYEHRAHEEEKRGAQ